MAKLASTVHVYRDGVPHAFGPDDEVPAWAVGQITNPKAWAEPPAPAQAAPPPQTGPGSGVKAWATYAAAHDVEVPDGASKDDVVAACEAAGVPTE